MAVYGFGATYDRDDVSHQFVDAGVACVGWNEADAPPLYNLLRHIKQGDIVFIKSFTPQTGLTIKAVGMVTSQQPRQVEDLGTGVNVRWVWHGEHHVGQLNDRYPVRTLTLFEEYSPAILETVLELLLSAVNSALPPTGSVSG